MEYEVFRFRDIATLINGRAYLMPELQDEGKYRIVRVGNFTGKDEWFYSDMELDEDKYCHKGDLLYKWACTFGPEIWKEEKTIYHYHIWKVIPKTGFDKGFLYYYLKLHTPYWLGGTNGATMVHITKASMENKKVSFPPYENQCEIADILSTYDELIENNNKRIAILEQMAENLYKECFVRRKNENWELIKLSQFGYSLESGSRPKGGIDSSLQEGYPSLGAEAIGDLGKFDYSATKLIPEDFYRKMKRGIGRDKDILLYKDGAYIGKVTLFMDEFPYKDYAINEHVFLMRSNDPLYQYYLYFTLALPQYFTQMQNLNRNAAQPGLTGKDINILKLYRPDEATIRKFNSAIEPMLHNIFILAKKNQNLIKQRDLLLPRLMSGKLEV